VGNLTVRGRLAVERETNSSEGRMYRNLSAPALGFTGRQSELIELALSFGFKGLDIDLADFQQTVKTYGLPHARRLIDSAKLKLGTFRLPLVWDEDDDAYKVSLATLTDWATLASEVGLTRAITTIAPANDLRPYPENFEFHRRRLAEIADQLAPHKIRLGVEFKSSPELRKDRAYQFIHTFDALATLIGMIRTPNVGIVADLFEMHTVGSTLEDARKLGDRIISIVLADAPADKAGVDCTEADRMLPGENGTIDLPAVLVTLSEMGYDGPLTPSVSPTQSQNMRREQIVKTAGERFTAAWTAAGLSPAGKLAPAAKK
jgi:sugar phosphate isomerase/epimerase